MKRREQYLETANLTRIFGATWDYDEKGKWLLREKEMKRALMSKYELFVGSQRGNRRGMGLKSNQSSYFFPLNRKRKIKRKLKQETVASHSSHFIIPSLNGRIFPISTRASGIHLPRGHPWKERKQERSKWWTGGKNQDVQPWFRDWCFFCSSLSLSVWSRLFTLSW